MPSTTSGPTVLITVGDEILTGHTMDTNSNFLVRALHVAGYQPRRIEVVADAVSAIVASIRRALAEDGVSRVVVSGGIGPTPDDRTFEAVAAALDRPLEESPLALAHIQSIVQRMFEAGWVETAEISEGNRRCALVPQGAEVLTNRRGMAPPLAIQTGGGRWLFVLPGVPRELTTVVEEELVPRYFTGAAAPLVAELRYTGVPEAEMYGPMRSLEREFPDIAVGSYPQSERRELVIRFRGGDASKLDAAVQRFLELRPGAESKRAGDQPTESDLALS